MIRHTQWHLHNKHVCMAQVYYEDLENGDRSEAYCKLVHCYSLPEDKGLWVEHGYFDDR